MQINRFGTGLDLKTSGLRNCVLVAVALISGLSCSEIEIAEPAPVVSALPATPAVVPVPSVPAREGVLEFSYGAPGVLLGRYSVGESFIGFEAHRQEDRTEEEMRADPLATPFAIAARFVDSEGKTFALKLDGHDKEPFSSWEVETPTNLLARKAALSLVVQAAKAMRSSKVTADYNSHLASLADLGAMAETLPSEKPFDSSTDSGTANTQNLPISSPTFVPPSLPYGESSNCLGRFIIDWYVTRKGAFFNWISYEHSALLTAYYGPCGAQPVYDVNNPSIVYPFSYPMLGYQVSCNHGACADDPSMARSCKGGLENLFTIQRVFPKGGNTMMNGGACPMTSPLDYGPFWGQHMCNDDTAVQIHSLMTNVDFSNSQMLCRRLAPLLWGPDCGAVTTVPPGQEKLAQISYGVLATINVAIMISPIFWPLR